MSAAALCAAIPLTAAGCGGESEDEGGQAGSGGGVPAACEKLPLLEPEPFHPDYAELVPVRPGTLFGGRFDPAAREFTAFAVDEESGESTALTTFAFPRVFVHSLEQDFRGYSFYGFTEDHFVYVTGEPLAFGPEAPLELWVVPWSGGDPEPVEGSREWLDGTRPNLFSTEQGVLVVATGSCDGDRQNVALVRGDELEPLPTLGCPRRFDVTPSGVFSFQTTGDPECTNCTYVGEAHYLDLATGEDLLLGVDATLEVDGVELETAYVHLYDVGGDDYLSAPPAPGEGFTLHPTAGGEPFSFPTHPCATASPFASLSLFASTPAAPGMGLQVVTTFGTAEDPGASRAFLARYDFGSGAVRTAEIPLGFSVAASAFEAHATRGNAPAVRSWNDRYLYGSTAEGVARIRFEDYPEFFLE